MQQDDKILKELISIKKLLILDLRARGIASTEVNKAVRMGEGVIRGMFPMKNLKKQSDR